MEVKPLPPHPCVPKSRQSRSPKLIIAAAGRGGRVEEREEGVEIRSSRSAQRILFSVTAISGLIQAIEPNQSISLQKFLLISLNCRRFTLF